MKVYNYHVDNKTELSDKEFKYFLDYQETDYNFDRLKDLKKFFIHNLISLNASLEETLKKNSNSKKLF